MQGHSGDSTRTSEVEGTIIRIVNHGQGVIEKPNGGIKNLLILRSCPYYKLRPTALGRKTWPFVSIRTHAAAIKSLNCLVDSSMHENKTKSGEPLGKSQWKGEGHFYAAPRS